MSPYLTLTYRECDAPDIKIKIGQLEGMASNMPSRKCLWTIPGLLSRSFKFESESEAQEARSLFRFLPVWVKQGLKSVQDTELNLRVDSRDVCLRELSFGFFESMMQYSWHKQIQGNNGLKYRMDIKHKYVAIHYRSSNRKEMRLNKDCLDNYCVVPPVDYQNLIIILPLKTPPRCYYKSRFHERSIDFGMIDEACIADTSALHLRFYDQKSLQSFMDFLFNVLALDVHQGSVQIVPKIVGRKFEPKLFDFWSNYAWKMLFTLGFRIKSRMTEQIEKKISQLSCSSRNEQYFNHPCYLKLVAVYYRARFNRFFDINEEFDGIQSLPIIPILDRWEYVPRVYLTPYGIQPLPVKPMRGNRILRQRDLFGPAEHFCRVIIRDVDLGQPQREFMQMCGDWIRQLILSREQINIGDRPFQFLLCSNSQLRDRSFWFHAPFRENTVNEIRAWMGDFSKEKCVGAHIARMALTLTGTNETIKLLPEQMEEIPDKFNQNGIAFTDGAGKISPSALRKALEAYNPNSIDGDYMPCGIQLRYGGLKGVFTSAPDLTTRGDLIQYRPSQHKFDSDHNILEIVKYSVSSRAFLNRQIIVLLENMGVKVDIFLNLQNKNRLRISMALLANKKAERLLEQHIRSYDWHRMQTSGFRLPDEPFCRSLLLVLTQDRLKRLREKSHVSIPFSDGRMLIGVVDETDSLQYGQVFIQLRNQENDNKQIICNRQVLITKNPAHFPGDIRKLNAVDCPKLHHLYECVVFPVNGPRPHPNEISGSDTDGDEYWVCWHETLVQNATQQYEPAPFDPPIKKKHPHPITMTDIAQFLVDYISGDSLGVFSNRHLASCALYGANHDISCRLARIIAEAVDFPKTGIIPTIPSDIRIDKYPDYMENKYKQSFVSQSALGEMYREIKCVHEIHMASQDKTIDEMIKIDEDLLIRGYEKYLNEAQSEYQYYSSRMNTIMSVYNLENEYELITGCHSGVEEEKKNNDSIETSQQEFRQLIQEMRERFSAEELSHREQQKKASARYFIAYQTGDLLSFGWIMERLLCRIKARTTTATYHQEHQALKCIANNLRRIQLEDKINNLANSFNIEINQEQEELIQLGQRFLDIIEHCNENAGKQNIAHVLLHLLHRIALNDF